MYVLAVGRSTSIAVCLVFMPAKYLNLCLVQMQFPFLGYDKPFDGTLHAEWYRNKEFRFRQLCLPALALRNLDRKRVRMSLPQCRFCGGRGTGCITTTNAFRGLRVHERILSSRAWLCR